MCVQGQAHASQDMSGAVLLSQPSPAGLFSREQSFLIHSVLSKQLLCWASNTRTHTLRLRENWERKTAWHRERVPGRARTECSRTGAPWLPSEQKMDQEDALSKNTALGTLTLQTAVCRMASKPPSGASRLPEMRSLRSSRLKSLMLLVRRMTFLKENGESALGQGSRSLGEMEQGSRVSRSQRMLGARRGNVGRVPQGESWS